jgi:hypothetical protein
VWSRCEPFEANDTDPSAWEHEADMSDGSEWVLLAETRTVMVLGRRPASRDTLTDETNSSPDGNPGEAVGKQAGRAATIVVVVGRQHR